MRMAHLAIVGSSSVNGVAELHTKLLRESLARICRILAGEIQQQDERNHAPALALKANPPLAQLITDTIGDRWITDLDALRDLENFADDPAFQERFRAAKQQNKQVLARYIEGTLGIGVSPESLFDVQVKRMHEYKCS